MEIDLANPVVQGAIIALVGVLLAAAAGVLGAIVGARIAAKAARETARITQAEAQAARLESREADERRHAWDIEAWYREKGVAAAEAILDLMIELDLNQFSYYSPEQREHTRRTGRAKEVEPDHGDLEPSYARIRRQAHAIKDGGVMETMLEMADCLWNYRTIEDWGGGQAPQIWYQLLRDTEAVLGAYVRGEPIPEARGIRSLTQTLKDYYEETSD